LNFRAIKHFEENLFQNTLTITNLLCLLTSSISLIDSGSNDSYLAILLRRNLCFLSKHRNSCVTGLEFSNDLLRLQRSKIKKHMI
jgi:uncharacterized membrane protein YadS